MKKALTLILITITFAASISLSVSIALAQNAPALFQPVTSSSKESKLQYVANLPRSDWGPMMGEVIKLILAITGSLAFAAFTYGGVMMITAQGNDEQIRKGKNLLFWAIFALVIIAGSYGIVMGISQLRFFQ